MTVGNLVVLSKLLSCSNLFGSHVTGCHSISGFCWLFFTTIREEEEAALEWCSFHLVPRFEEWSPSVVSENCEFNFGKLHGTLLILTVVAGLKFELLDLPKRGRSHYVMSCLFELCHKVRSHLPFTWWACLALCPHSLLALPTKATILCLDSL
jgi:hypothetical protein